MSVWDHSWLTPRLVCGFRFMRIPPKSGVEGGIFLPLHVMSAEDHLLSGQAEVERTKLDQKDIALGTAAQAQDHLLWIFDGTEFQDRALRFYDARGPRGPPPMEDVWLLSLITAVPTTLKNNVLSGSGMMELQCSAMVLLGSYLYAEYMLMLVPPAVLLKYFQHTWEVHSRMGTVESADEMLSHFSVFSPLNAAMERFQERLHARGQVAYCAQVPQSATATSPHCLKLPELTGTFGGLPVLRPLVDVLIVRCGEDLQWVIQWLKHILRDEWTPEVLGLQLRLVIYEKCQAAADSSERPWGHLVQDIS
eukprot:Skav205225  [mRNA]  locus=scaffold400:318951:320288:- [translate_table: standard]